MFRRISYGLGVMVALACISCDKVPLLAPTNSTVTIDAQSRVVPTGGSTEVTATVLESSGTPVQNGTVVRFTTTLGRMDPVEAQTRNGLAVTTFIAGNDSGMADVRATSGGAGGTSTTTPGTGGTPGTTTTTNSNIVQIAVGAGAVDTVTIRGIPATVSTNGGTVTLIATVVGTGGRLLSGISVSFSATRGTLSSPTATTDASGEARVSLTTNGDTDVTATAGTKTATAKITGQPGANVTLSCAVGATTNCANATVNQTIVFTAQRVAGSSNLVSSTLDFGDGSSASLGTLGGPVNVSHAYSGTGTYTARLVGTDVNGETASASQVIQVTNVATVTINTSVAGLTVTATATVGGGTPTQFAWTFEGSTPNRITSDPTATYTYTTVGAKTVSLTVTFSDGRTVTVSVPVTV